MQLQLDLYGNEVKVAPKPTNKAKRNWENAFQRWSDNMHLNEPSVPYGKCGYGSMCDFCSDNDYGRPCVRALNEMCRVEQVTIDYSKRNFSDIWNGDF